MPNSTQPTQLTQAQIDAFPYGNLDDYIYLGSNHWYQLMTCSHSEEGEFHGLIQPHLDRYSDWCGGSVTFEGHNHDSSRHATWQVLSLEPLHIEPSLLCKSRLWKSGHGQEECGDHGFIRNGKWVSA